MKVLTVYIPKTSTVVRGQIYELFLSFLLQFSEFQKASIKTEK